MDDGQKRAPVIRRPPRRKIFWVGILVIVLLLGCGVFWINFSQPVVSVSPRQVRAGEVFTVTEMGYSHDYARWFDAMDLRFINHDGVNIALTDANVAQSAGLTNITEAVGQGNSSKQQLVQGVLNTKSGVVRTSLYESMFEKMSYLGDKNGPCFQIAFGYVRTYPWDKFEQSFTVLPATPPGTYTVQITPEYYCDSWGPTRNIEITVIK